MLAGLEVPGVGGWVVGGDYTQWHTLTKDCTASYTIFAVTNRIFALQWATAWGTLMFRESIVRGAGSQGSVQKPPSPPSLPMLNCLEDSAPLGPFIFSKFLRGGSRSGIEPRFLCLPAYECLTTRPNRLTAKVPSIASSVLLNVRRDRADYWGWGAQDVHLFFFFSLVTTREVWNICIAMLSVFLWQEVFHLQRQAFKFSMFVPLSL